jgi:nitroreductase
VPVLSLHRVTMAAGALGPARGWRHALLEVGLVGEHCNLAAPSAGLAACAVGAFYDDEAAALVCYDPRAEWVLHFVAIGSAA